MDVHSEWALLVIAEDIEVGDTISVESEEGATEDMVFIGESKKGVKLKDVTGEVHYFSEDSLEEVNGYRVISGKSENELRLK